MVKEVQASESAGPVICCEITESSNANEAFSEADPHSMTFDKPLDEAIAEDRSDKTESMEETVSVSVLDASVLSESLEAQDSDRVTSAIDLLAPTGTHFQEQPCALNSVEGETLLPNKRIQKGSAGTDEITNSNWEAQVFPENADSIRSKANGANRGKENLPSAQQGNYIPLQISYNVPEIVVTGIDSIEEEIYAQNVAIEPKKEIFIAENENEVMEPAVKASSPLIPQSSELKGEISSEGETNIEISENQKKRPGFEKDAILLRNYEATNQDGLKESGVPDPETTMSKEPDISSSKLKIEENKDIILPEVADVSVCLEDEGVSSADHMLLNDFEDSMLLHELMEANLPNEQSSASADKVSEFSEEKPAAGSTVAGEQDVLNSEISKEMNNLSAENESENALPNVQDAIFSLQQVCEEADKTVVAKSLKKEKYGDDSCSLTEEAQQSILHEAQQENMPTDCGDKSLEVEIFGVEDTTTALDSASKQEVSNSCQGKSITLISVTSMVSLEDVSLPEEQDFGAYAPECSMKEKHGQTAYAKVAEKHEEEDHLSTDILIPKGNKVLIILHDDHSEICSPAPSKEEVANSIMEAQSLSNADELENLEAFKSEQIQVDTEKLMSEEVAVPAVTTKNYHQKPMSDETEFQNLSAHLNIFKAMNQVKSPEVVEEHEAQTNLNMSSSTTIESTFGEIMHESLMVGKEFESYKVEEDDDIKENLNVLDSPEVVEEHEPQTHLNMSSGTTVESTFGEVAHESLMDGKGFESYKAEEADGMKENLNSNTNELGFKEHIPGDCCSGSNANLHFLDIGHVTDEHILRLHNDEKTCINQEIGTPEKVSLMLPSDLEEKKLRLLSEPKEANSIKESVDAAASESDPKGTNMGAGVDGHDNPCDFAATMQISVKADEQLPSCSGSDMGSIFWKEEMEPSKMVSDVAPAEKQADFKPYEALRSIAFDHNNILNTENNLTDIPDAAFKDLRVSHSSNENEKDRILEPLLSEHEDPSPTDFVEVMASVPKVIETLMAGISEESTQNRGEKVFSHTNEIGTRNDNSEPNNDLDSSLTLSSPGPAKTTTDEPSQVRDALPKVNVQDLDGEKILPNSLAMADFPSTKDNMVNRATSSSQATCYSFKEIDSMQFLMEKINGRPLEEEAESEYLKGLCMSAHLSVCTDQENSLNLATAEKFATAVNSENILELPTLPESTSVTSFMDAGLQTSDWLKDAESIIEQRQGSHDIITESGNHIATQCRNEVSYEKLTPQNKAGTSQTKVKVDMGVQNGNSFQKVQSVANSSQFSVGSEAHVKSNSQVNVEKKTKSDVSFLWMILLCCSSTER